MITVAPAFAGAAAFFRVRKNGNDSGNKSGILYLQLQNK